jgi:hypothetical protein
MPYDSAADRRAAYRRRVLSERDGLLAALAAPREAMDRTLAGLVTANAGTSFGLEHDFKSIRGPEDFRSAVPIRDYDALAPWINRAAHGERGVLSADEPGSRAPWAELPVPVGDTDYLDKAYLRLRLAVEHDVRGVIGINPAAVAALTDQLGQWWPEIVRELRDGTAGGRRYGPQPRACP